MISLFFCFRFIADKQSFSQVDRRVERFFYIFACANSVMDPFVYGYFNLRPSSRPTSDAAVKNTKTKDIPHSESEMKTADQNLKNGIAENSYGTFQPE